MSDIIPYAQPMTVQQPEPFRRSYIRDETLPALFHGKNPVNAITSILQILDPMGLSPAQLDQRQKTYGQLYEHLIRTYPQEAAQARQQYQRPPFDPVAQRDWIGEDLSSVRIKADQWFKQQAGQELTPQERVTQGFMDVRNPNSWF